MSEQEHLHLYELPGWLVRKGSSTQICCDEVLGSMYSLRSTGYRVQTSASAAEFLINSIISGKHFTPDPSHTYAAVEDFVYHYENYCLRAFVFREKTLLYLNAGLLINFPTSDVKLMVILNNDITKKAGLLSTLKKFDSRSSDPLGKLIKDRNSLTHRLYYESTDRYFRPSVPDDDNEDEFKKWCKEWFKNIKEKSELVDQAENHMDLINHALAEKVLAYREKLKKSK